jgi:RND family efflux transporter MFP subunit
VTSFKRVRAALQARWRLGLVVVAALTNTQAGAQPPPPFGTGQPLPIAPEIRAQLTPRQYTTLSSEMAARIDRIATRVGERFKKGEELVAFDCAIQRGQVASARAVVQKAEKVYAINVRLLQLKSIGPLELAVSEAELNKARADLTVAEATAGKCTIAAPFNGITVEQKAREFQYANPGQALLDILETENLEVELIAPSRWLAWLKPGHEFQIRIDETDKTYPARVARLGGRVDPVSQSIKVIGEIATNAPELMAGMSGRVDIAPPR